MTLFIAGLLLFFAVHSLRAIAPQQREVLVARMGPSGWKAVYSVLSLAGFVMLAYGYGAVRWTSPMLWLPPPPWVRMAVALAMLPVLVVFVSAYLPGRIRAGLRHPMVLATAAWAALHLLVNGRVADLLLFGGFLAWALLLVVTSYRRPAAAGARAPALAWDAVAVAVGTAAWWWLSFGGGHALLFTMPVMSMPHP